jgi:hypothetical protein
MTDIFETESVPDLIAEELRPWVGEKLAEILDMPLYAATEMLVIDIDGPNPSELEKSPDYFIAEIYIDRPLITEDGRDLAAEIRAFVEKRETVEIDGIPYLLNACVVGHRHDPEFEDAYESIFDDLKKLFNDASAPQILVDTDKTADCEDVLVIDATERKNIDPVLLDKAAEIIARTVQGMENRPEIRIQGTFPELKIEPPSWTI